jgi:glycosyltransferase involved in cell wall biosynthesis
VPVIGFVGRADDPRKNIGLLLRAFALVREELPASSLRLIGTPPTGPTDHGVDVTGEVPEVASFVRECTILVLPSFQEGFGIVVAEALASGVPVIVTPCGGPEAIVRSSGAGRVTLGWSARELADTLLELLGDLRGLGEGRKAARAYVEREQDPARFRTLLAEAFLRLDG